jgi:hypothetical protein
MIKRCVALGMLYRVTGGPEDAPCERRYGDEVRDRPAKADARLGRALAEVRRRAPEARVYVVGYPAILPPDGAGCTRAMSSAPGDETYLRERERQLNDMLRERAEAAGVAYADTYTPAEEHSACAPEDTRWIEPLGPGSPAAAVHTDERAERGMADAVLRAMSTGLVNAEGAGARCRTPAPTPL